MPEQDVLEQCSSVPDAERRVQAARPGFTQLSHVCSNNGYGRGDVAWLVVLSAAVQAGACLAARHRFGVMGRLCLCRQRAGWAFAGELPNGWVPQCVV